MRITKKETKLMAFILTFVMMLSGLVCVPERAAAATSAPTVKILGATMRLGDSPALRIGIEISNASQAKNCGITLTVGEKTMTVKTGEGGYNNIYDYNEATDKVIYTVALTGMTETDFTTDIKAKGEVEPLEGDTTYSDEITKNVNGVVDAINEQQGTGLCFEGGKWMNKIVYDFEEGENDPNFKNYYTTDHPEWINLREKAIQSTESQHGTYSIGLHTQQYGSLNLPELTTLGKYTITCYVKKPADVDNGDYNKVTLGPGYDGTPVSVTLSDEWQRLEFSYNLKEMKTSSWGAKNNQIKVAPEAADNVNVDCSYLVDYVTVLKEATVDDVVDMELPRDFSVDLSKANEAVVSGLSTTNYSGGIFTADYAKKDGGGGLGYFVKANRTSVVPADYEKIVIKLEADKAVNLFIGGYGTDTTWYPNSDGKTWAYTSITDPSKEFVYEYTPKADDTDPLYWIKIKRNPADKEDDNVTITIKSIEFIVKK